MNRILTLSSHTQGILSIHDFYYIGLGQEQFYRTFSTESHTFESTLEFETIFISIVNFSIMYNSYSFGYINMYSYWCNVEQVFINSDVTNLHEYWATLVLLLPVINTIFIPSICIVPIPHLMLFISLCTSLLILLKHP